MDILTTIHGSLTMMNINLLGNSLQEDEWNDREAATKWVWNVELSKWTTRQTRVCIHKVILPFWLLSVQSDFVSESSMYLQAGQRTDVS